MCTMSISGYIKSDLQVRLRNGQTLPAELTLVSLAEHYDVSFTPVRTAVRELVNEGLLHKGVNGRLEPVMQNGQTTGDRLGSDDGLGSRDRLGSDDRLGGGETLVPPAMLVPPEPPRDLLKIIGDDLVRLSLQGVPVAMREEAVARQYGVSRTVIRNIFSQLVGVGLLIHSPRRGWTVQPFRSADLRDFLEVRELLELRALDLAQSRLVVEELQTLLDRNVLPVTEEDWPQVDHYLHAYLVEKAGESLHQGIL